jgi:CheY-like chemotaxis protein
MGIFFSVSIDSKDFSGLRKQRLLARRTMLFSLRNWLILAGKMTTRPGQIGDNNKAVLIVVLTAYAMSRGEEKFLAAGVDGYITKPVEVKGLNSVARKLLDNR